MTNEQIIRPLSSALCIYRVCFNGNFEPQIRLGHLGRQQIP